MKLAIIDTGCANLTSVRLAFERLAIKPVISDDVALLSTADKLILPGVGAASAGMKALDDKHLSSFIQQTNKPLLGICLGMQLLSQQSTESAQNQVIDCLKVVPGNTQLLETGDLHLPHMGWNQIEHNGSHALLKGIKPADYFYFVHSYVLSISTATVATCTYGQAFSAIVEKNNFFGVQFHPERSGATGAKLLRNFLAL